MSRATDTPSGDFLSMDDAAAMLGCSTKTVRRRIAEGTFTAYRAGGGRHLLLDRAQVLSALAPIPTAY